MESTTVNNNVNAIKEVRELFNEFRSNLSCEQKILEKNSINFIEKKMPTIF